VEGLGFKVSDLGFIFFEFEVWGLVLSVGSVNLGCRFSSLGFRVQGSGFKFQGSRLRIRVQEGVTCPPNKSAKYRQ
jgi:hypothetical protein